MTNLYREIKNLTYRKQEIRNQAGLLKWKKRDTDEYRALCAEHEEIEQALSVIEKEFPITPFMMQQIVSKYTGEEYKLKSFRETYMDDGDVYYSHRFVVCLLNKDNKFFNYEQHKQVIHDRANPEETYDEYCIDTKDFVELNKSLTWTGFDGPYILASSDEAGFRPILPPSDYLQTINYTKILTSNFYDNFSSFDFQHLIRDMLKNHFESIEIDEKSAKPSELGEE